MEFRVSFIQLLQIVLEIRTVTSPDNVRGGDNCGGVVDLTQVGAMTITATDSDNDGIYDDNLDCWWAFTVDEGTIVFESNFFNIEFQSSCGFDWVQLLDGSGEFLGGQAKYCGTTIGSSFQTTSRSLYLWFHTDFCCVTGGPPTGFNFTVKAVLP
ncbi:CUBN-like protein [Mya arenaria]|uniref:CUBN-like protein n=1 Tax=Mya arenaria TaxID=6604 RepID=A0ABY7EAH6_MYAAR|nr:CUBN-like protein [Mya arenaria]